MMCMFTLSAKVEDYFKDRSFVLIRSNVRQ